MKIMLRAGRKAGQPVLQLRAENLEERGVIKEFAKARQMLSTDWAEPDEIIGVSVDLSAMPTPMLFVSPIRQPKKKRAEQPKGG
jgi:hypothetical protein